MESFSIILKILYTFESGIAQLVERILVDGKGGGGQGFNSLSHTYFDKENDTVYVDFFACW